MKKLVEMPALPKDTASSSDQNNKVIQAKIPSNATSSRDGMRLVCQKPLPKSGGDSSSVEEVGRSFHKL